MPLSASVGSARFAPDATAARQARALVTERAADAGLSGLADDAAVMVSELVANAVMHARTEVVVDVTADAGVLRVAVRDGSPTMPLPGGLGSTAMSGRGLLLVQAMASRWGVEPLPDGGKSVWFELTGATRPGPGTDPLAAVWGTRAAGSAGPGPAGPRLVRVVVPDVPVQALLAAKVHMEDLIRELKLVLLNAGSRVTAGRDTPEAVRLARRLDAAVEEFGDARLQMRSQGMAAGRRGQERVTLELTIRADAAEAAERYREAVEGAEELARQGSLLTLAQGLSQHARLRRWYLGEIIAQLRAASGHPPGQTDPPRGAGPVAPS